MHLHTSAMDFVAMFAMAVLALALMRAISATWPDSPFGKAFAVLN